MTMGEYEERFRTPAPSLYQIFAAIRGPKATRRRSRRFWVAPIRNPPEPPNTPCGLAFQPRRLNCPRPRPAGNAATRLPAFAARLMTGAAR
jgi:hypothetical protein